MKAEEVEVTNDMEIEEEDQTEGTKGVVVEGVVEGVEEEVETSFEYCVMNNV